MRDLINRYGGWPFLSSVTAGAAILLVLCGLFGGFRVLFTTVGIAAVIWAFGKRFREAFNVALYWTPLVLVVGMLIPVVKLLCVPIIAVLACAWASEMLKGRVL